MNVIGECLKHFGQDFIYLLDNKNCPYGNKSVSHLKQILKENINYLLNNYNLDLIIIACNTLSCLICYDDLLNYKVPILKTVPAVKYLKGGGNNVLVFATKNTIKNSKELKLIKINYPKVKMVSIKNLAKLIDDYLIQKTNENKYEIKKILKYNFIKNNKFAINSNLNKINCIKTLNNKEDNLVLLKKYNSIEYISLGCTHFKYIKKDLTNIFGKKIKFFECEKQVGKTSKWLIRKNTKISTLNLILTDPNCNLEKNAYQMFNNLVKGIVT